LTVAPTSDRAIILLIIIILVVAFALVVVLGGLRIDKGEVAWQRRRELFR